MVEFAVPASERFASSVEWLRQLATELASRYELKVFDPQQSAPGEIGPVGRAAAESSAPKRPTPWEQPGFLVRTFLRP